MNKTASGIILVLLLIGYVSFVVSSSHNVYSVYGADEVCEIDLFSQRGGIGINASSPPFETGERIILFASVACNQTPAPQVIVAFQVDNPEDIPILISTAITNSSGIATINFTIAREMYPSYPSLWKAYVTSSPLQETVQDIMPFYMQSAAQLITVPDDYPTIQEAINAASDGDTVFVRNGTYHENVIVNKTVLLIGENRNTTIIYGSQNGDAIRITANNVSVSNFTMTNGAKGVNLDHVNNCILSENAMTHNTEDGVHLYYSHSNILTNNIISDNSHKHPQIWHGIWLEFSDNNVLTNNTITDSDTGLRLWYASFNLLRSNKISNNSDNFEVYGDTLHPDYWNQDIDTSNSADGKPIYYWTNQENRKIPLDAGYIYLINCRNITIRDLNLTNCGVTLFRSDYSRIMNLRIEHAGIWLGRSSNNVVANSTITRGGIILSSNVSPGGSDHNTISNNSISDGYGVALDMSAYNTIKENIITRNSVGVSLESLSNYNTVDSNSIEENREIGIDLFQSSSNLLVGNYIERNPIGLRVYWGSNGNIVYHNRIMSGTPVSIDNCINVWDNGYPSGGNYWIDHNYGLDLYSGPYQNQTGSDGIGDTPYIFDANNKDRYPLVFPDIAVTVIWPSKTIIGHGYPLNITVTVANQGPYDENFNLTVYANTTEIWNQAVALSSQKSTQIAVQFNTDGFEIGNYTITANVTILENEVDIFDNVCTIFAWQTIKITIPGDINGDFFVNIADVGLITANWLKSVPPAPANADVNGDGIINIADVGPLATNWLKHA